MTLFTKLFKLPIVLFLILTMTLFGAITFGGGCCTHRIPEQITTSLTTSDDAKLAEQLQRHSLAIYKTDRNTRDNFVGSGNYIRHKGSPHVLTAYHVWEYAVAASEDVSICYGLDECAIVGNDSKVAVSPGEDWALIKLPEKLDGATYAKLGDPDTLEPIGEKIFITGYPSGTHLYLFGHIAGYSMLPGEMFDHYTLQTYAYFGASGGGVYNSDGELIGIVEALAVRITGAFGPPVRIENPNIIYSAPIVEMEEIFEKRNLREFISDLPSISIDTSI